MSVVAVEAPPAPQAPPVVEQAAVAATIDALTLPDNPRTLALNFIQQPKKSGDLVEDCRRDNVHKAKLRLLVYLSSSDDMVEPALNMLVTGKCTNKEKAISHTALSFDENGTRTLSKVPKYWIGEWIVRVTQGNISTADISNMDKANPGAIKSLFFFLTSLDPNTPLPKRVLEKVICDKMCTQRAVQVGSRWQGWRARALRADSTVDWSVGGAFSIKKAEGGGHSIEHISGASVPFPAALRPEHITMTDPFSDGRCQMEMVGVPPMRVKDLFGKDAGPNSKAIGNARNSVLQKLADDVANEVDDARAMAAMRADDQRTSAALESSFKTNQKERRAAARPKSAPNKRRKTCLTIQMT